MARTVFVFGAGSSARLGIPHMNGFIDAADELRQSSEIGNEAFELFFSLVQDEAACLRGGHLDLHPFGALHILLMLARSRGGAWAPQLS